jgi:hypothetical protein
VEQQFYFGGFVPRVSDVFFNGPKYFPNALFDVEITAGIDVFKHGIDLFLYGFNIAFLAIGFKKQIGEQFLVLFFEAGQTKA